MKLFRRRFLQLAGATVALPGAACFAWAQSYPSRPVRIVSTSAAGGTNDIIARQIGQWLSDRLGQPFVIENRPGAGGNIAAELAARAPPDGYTLLMVSTSLTIGATFYDNLNYNLVRDIAPVASISRETPIMLVHPSVPAKTVPEFIAYAKAHPGDVNMASAGTGSGPHMNGELFKMMTGVKMVHVPYRGGGPALIDLLAGQVQVMFPGTTASIAYIRAGRLRPLAVTTATRSQMLPELPTVGDFVPGYEASAIFGVGAPRNTPAEIVDRLNREINAALVDPTVKARIVGTCASVLAGSPADFGRLIAEDTEKWAKVVKFSGSKPE
ncbi:MAG TPA: tripartite tricarboxylate transporter substrate binding protein [Xanthobacteraceae bacterium]|nr:tripartite tricarboxylate transporter substrate binding protein [Xanthobacteraceae bacterium]